jgi:TonB family protein
MKPGVILIFILLTSFSANAQSKEKITEYFNKDWLKTGNREEAAYYRTVEPARNGVILVRDYFISGKLQMFSECSSASPLKFNGKCIKYFESGAIDSEEYYIDNTITGAYKSYYEDGKLKKEMMYHPKRAVIIHYYSETGVELLPYGKGIIKHKGNEDFDSYEEVEDSVSLAIFSVSRTKGDTVYSMVEKPAEYKGGLSAMSQDVSFRLRYPKSARRNGVEGTVYVAFDVDKTGAIVDPHVIKGIDPDCDAEALATVASLPNWIPGEMHGKPVRSKFVLPIKFRLTGWFKKS